MQDGGVPPGGMMPGMPGMPGMPPNMPGMPHGMPMYPGMMYPGYPAMGQDGRADEARGDKKSKKKRRKSSQSSSASKKGRSSSSSAGRRKKKKPEKQKERARSDSSSGARRRAAAAAVLAGSGAKSGGGRRRRSGSRDKKEEQRSPSREKKERARSNSREKKEKEQSERRSRSRDRRERRSGSRERRDRRRSPPRSSSRDRRARQRSDRRSRSRDRRNRRRRSESRGSRRRGGSRDRGGSRSRGRRRGDREGDKTASVYDSRGSPPEMDTQDAWNSDRARGFRGPEKVEVLKVPRSMIGRIIGKGGATIKDIRDRSGARVDAREQNEDPCSVLISGAEAAVATAASMVLAIVEGGGASAIATGDAPDAGALVPFGGPGGAQGHRGFSDGPPAAGGGVSKFSDTPPPGVSSEPRTLGGLPVPAAGTPASATVGGGAPLPLLAGLSSGPMVEVHLELPVGSAGKIIGTKGQQISEVRTQSGAQVDLDKSSTMCKVRLVGTQQQVEAAREIITKIMAPPTNEGEFMEIPRSAVGRLIGAGGARIQELQERSGAKINIDRTTERCLVRFSGTPERMAAARSLVADVLEGRDRAASGEASTYIEVPQHCTGRLIGPGGRQINEIQEKSGAKVDIDKAKEPHTVHIVGTRENVARAESMIKEVLQDIARTPMPELGGIQPPPPNTPPPPMLSIQNGSFPPAPPGPYPGGPPALGGGGFGGAPGGGGFGNGGNFGGGSAAGQFDEETIRLEVPEAAVSKVFLDGGAWVRDVEQKTGARIAVRNYGESSGRCYLEMSGQPEQVVEAEDLANAALQSLAAQQLPAMGGMSDMGSMGAVPPPSSMGGMGAVPPPSSMGGMGAMPGASSMAAMGAPGGPPPPLSGGGPPPPLSGGPGGPPPPLSGGPGGPPRPFSGASGGPPPPLSGARGTPPPPLSGAPGGLPPPAASPFFLARPRGPAPMEPLPPLTAPQAPMAQAPMPGSLPGVGADMAPSLRPPPAPGTVGLGDYGPVGQEDFFPGGCWPSSGEPVEPQPLPPAGQPPDWGGLPPDWGAGQGQDWGGQSAGVGAAPWRRF